MSLFSNLRSRLVGSVDSIVGEFHKVANKLDVRAKLHAEEQVVHDKLVAAHTAASEFAAKEKAKAEAIAAKIRALVS